MMIECRTAETRCGDIQRILTRDEITIEPKAMPYRTRGATRRIKWRLLVGFSVGALAVAQATAGCQAGHCCRKSRSPW